MPVQGYGSGAERVRAVMKDESEMSAAREGEMALALDEARQAAARGEVPVGAVLLDGAGAVLARAGNRVEEWHDPSAHAEMLVMREAVRQRGGRRGRRGRVVGGRARRGRVTGRERRQELAAHRRR